MNIDTNLPIDGSFAPNYRFDADNGFDDQSSLSTSLVVPAPVPPELKRPAKKTHPRVAKRPTPREARIREASIPQAAVLQTPTADMPRNIYKPVSPVDSRIFRRRRPSSAPLQSKKTPSIDPAVLVEESTDTNKGNMDEDLILSSLSLNTAAMGDSSARPATRGAPMRHIPEWFASSAQNSDMASAASEKPSNPSMTLDEKHRFFHSTKLQAHATRRFSLAENKRLKGRVEHLQRKEAKIKKEMYDYHQLMEKRIRVLREQKRLRQDLNRAREETARRNGLLNDAARDIHKRLSNSKRERAASLRQAAQRTAQESRRNNEAYQNLKKTRIADNRKIRKEIHRKRRMGTKRALAFQDAKMNKVIKARAEATRAANQKHKKRLKLNSRLAKKEAAMRELVDNLYDYKLVYENQLESMCQILENEVGELRKEGRAKVVFGVPKLKRKKGTGNQTAVVAGNRKKNINKIPRHGPPGKKKGRKRHKRILNSTPRSLGNPNMSHHLQNFDYETPEEAKRKHRETMMKEQRK
jgi:hypothetical protein